MAGALEQPSHGQFRRRKRWWFDIPPQRTADAGRNSTQTVSHAPQSEANALHRRAAEQLPPRSRRQSDPSALNVSQQSADSLRPYALRTRATAGAARTASAARAPHAASQHVAALMAEASENRIALGQEVSTPLVESLHRGSEADVATAVRLHRSCHKGVRYHRRLQ